MYNKDELIRILASHGLKRNVLKKMKKDELRKMVKIVKKSGSGIIKDVFDNSFAFLSNTVRKRQDPKKVRLLLPGEYHLTGLYNPKTGQTESSNFMGPGTRIDLPEVRNFQPYNLSDAVAMKHDMAYERASHEPDQIKRQKLIREADRDMINDLRKVPNDELLKYYGLAGIQFKNKLEDFTPSKIAKLLPAGYYGKS